VQQGIDLAESKTYDLSESSFTFGVGAKYVEAKLINGVAIGRE
jgi:hypothetical protein